MAVGISSRGSDLCKVDSFVAKLFVGANGLENGLVLVSRTLCACGFALVAVNARLHGAHVAGDFGLLETA